MLGAVQKLLKKENFETQTKNMTQYTRPDEVRYKKRTPHKTWLCNNCGHLYFYAIFRCPICESKEIKNTVYHSSNTLEKDVVIDEEGLI